MRKGEGKRKGKWKVVKEVESVMGEKEIVGKIEMG